MTRTNPKFTRIYVSGYDVSGVANNFGTAGFETETDMVAAYSDEVKNTILGKQSVKCGPVNAFLSPSSSTGLHELFSPGSSIVDVLIAWGTSGVPVVGSPCFAWKMSQEGYQGGGEGIVPVTIPMPNAAYTAPNGYVMPFGFLAHANGAETAANTGVATIDAGASTAKGGVFVYQLLSSNGTVTLSLDHASTNLNANFAALTGATSGSINASVTPKSGMVALTSTLTVNRYIRWQLAFGTATTATFVCAFLRGV